MSNNSAIVTDFLATWSSKDVDRIMQFFTEDAVYTNIPIDPPNEGVDAIRATIEGFVGMATEIEFITHHQAENTNGVVMNERTDRFLVNDKWTEIRVMGIFELRDGKLCGWRDYFDMQQFSAQM